MISAFESFYGLRFLGRTRKDTLVTSRCISDLKDGEQ